MYQASDKAIVESVGSHKPITWNTLHKNFKCKYKSKVKRHDAPRSYRRKSREKERGNNKGHNVKKLPQF